MNHKLDSQVQDALQNATLSGDGMQLTLPPLHPTLYARVDKYLKSIGGKWNRHKRVHLFERDANANLERFTSSEELPKLNALDYFPTPPMLAARIAEQLADHALLFPHLRRCVLEPSAGEGALALALRERGFQVTCIELDPIRAGKLHDLGFEVQQGDFLEFPPIRFPFVAMNPPFSAPGVRYAYPGHIRKAHGQLKPGGLLVSVVPADAIQSGSTLKDLIEAQGWGQMLPSGSFRASGTAIETALLSLRGPAPEVPALSNPRPMGVA